MAEVQTGTFTFLFTDIEGSTARWEADREAMAPAVRRHDELTSAAVAAAGGEVVKSTGDGSLAVFADAAAAASAALSLRETLDSEPWPPTVSPFRVRMGIHSGPAEARGGDYFGPTLNRAWLLADAGHGGQILVSETTRRLMPADAHDLKFLGEHRLRDLLEPELIYQLGDPDESYDPIRVLDRRSHNLPIQVTSFVGRQRELANVTDMVTRHRLVTLTGPGGTGKTRVALQAAAELTSRFDRVAFVPLASVGDADEVLPAIGDALGLQDRSAVSVPDLIVRQVAGALLIVLDNFEHVIAASAELGALLERSAELHLLVTSREILRLRAEHPLPLEPMGLPDPSMQEDLEVLRTVESVRLFEERAGAAQPGFLINTANASDVAAICRRLDGLPLAIELAAARVRLFTPSQLRTQLESDPRALGAGPVDAPERQRTLLDTIAWSYALLDDGEQELFRHLAVFKGGRSLEAVMEVCVDHLSLDAATGIEALADKSLITIGQGSTGDVRVHLLDTIFRFARSALEDSAEYPVLRGRHADYFAAMALAAEKELRGPNQAYWNKRLEEDRPNLIEALEWSFASGATERGMEIVAGLRDFWFYQGHEREMGQWVRRALAVADDADPQLRAGVYMSAGFHSYLDYRSVSDDLFQQAAALYEEMGDPERQALALIWSAGSRELLDTDLDGARQAVNEGLELARRVGAIAHEAQALNMLGELERTQGNYELAWRLQEEGLERSREAGELRRVAMMTHNLGLIAHHLGNDEKAERLLLESLELSLDQQFTAQTAHSLLSLAEQIALRGDPETATLLIGYSDSVFAQMGIRPQPADEPDYIRIRGFVESEMGTEAYREAIARGATLDLDEAVSLVHGP